MRRHALGAGLIGLAVLAAGCAAGGHGASGHGTGGPDRGPGGITVTGTGRVSVRPDTALVQVGAEARAPLLAEATAEVARRTTAVLARVRELGVEERDIRTVSYAVEPVMSPPRDPQSPPPRIAGYHVVNVVELRIRRLDAAGAVLDGAVAAGANVVRALHFTLADPSAAEADARARAVRDAAEQARQLAEAAGVRLGPLRSLTEGGGGPAPRVMSYGRMLSTAAPGPVEAGQLEVVVTVQARYGVEPRP
jgi:uncharacterized protein YggE